MEALRDSSPGDDVSESVEERVAAQEYDGTVTKTNARDETLITIYTRLREARELTRSEIEEFHATHDGGLAASTWYETLVSKELRKLPGVRPPKQGTSQWRFDPDGAVER